MFFMEKNIKKFVIDKYMCEHKWNFINEFKKTTIKLFLFTTTTEPIYILQCENCGELKKV